MAITATTLKPMSTIEEIVKITKWRRERTQTREKRARKSGGVTDLTDLPFLLQPPTRGSLQSGEWRALLAPLLIRSNHTQQVMAMMVETEKAVVLLTWSLSSSQGSLSSWSCTSFTTLKVRNEWTLNIANWTTLCSRPSKRIRQYWCSTYKRSHALLLWMVARPRSTQTRKNTMQNLSKAYLIGRLWVKMVPFSTRLSLKTSSNNRSR